MPISPAMASSVVPSKPRRANSRNAARSISAWLVAGGRPSREAPCGVAIVRTVATPYFLSLSAITLRPGTYPAGSALPDSLGGDDAASQLAGQPLGPEPVVRDRRGRP